MNMQVSPITQEDKNFIEVGMEMANEIVYHYIPSWSGGEITHLLLDQVFAAWLKEQTAYEPNMIVNSLGIALGEYMVAQLGMNWVIVNDQYGTAMAVRHENPEWTTFPFDAIQKRIQSKEVPFFAFLFGDAEKCIHNNN